MITLRALLIAIVLTSISFSRTEATEPALSDFFISDEDRFEGIPAPVDLTSDPSAINYGLLLQNGAKIGPNFAGSYTIVTLMCGSYCQMNWVIDARTGKIVTVLRSMIGIKHQLDSKLLVVNPLTSQLQRAFQEDPLNPIWNQIQTKYEVWNHDKFNTIRVVWWKELINSVPHDYKW